MFTTARAKSTKKTWRAVLIGATVPIAMLGAAPAVGAADIDRAETVVDEQLPPAPAPPGAPDPLTDLLTCVTELLAALDSQAPAPPAPAPAGAEAEQLPPLPPGAEPPPDIAALTAQCEAALAKLQPQTPPAPPAPPAALPKD
jgi:hypothetical protein